MTQRTAQKRSPRRTRSPGAGAEPGMAAVADTVVPFPPATGSGAAGVMLAADCTARCAEDMKAALLARLDQPAAVSIDVAAVERVDTVCLQLLVAFVRDRQRAGRAVLWAGHSEPLAQAAGLLGLSAALGVAAAG